MLRRPGPAGPSRHLTCALLVTTAALMLVLLLAPRAEAGAPTDALRGVFAEANKVLVDPATEGRLAERLTAVRKLLRGVFEFRDAAQLALGREWQVRTSTERDEFVLLFADLVELAYVYTVACVTRAQAVSVRYLGESVDGNLATVRTGVARKMGGEVFLDYEMVQRTDRWMIRDVLIGGVSLMANYRAQFQRISRDSSYLGLVTRIKTKTTEWTRALLGPAEPDTSHDRVAAAPPMRLHDGSPAAPGVDRLEPGPEAVTLWVAAVWFPGKPGQAP